MSSFEQLKSQAEALGLQGEEVGRYVIQQQAYDREERSMKRREEQEEKERQRKLELARLEAEKEIELARIAASAKSPSPASGGECADRSRLPAYIDGIPREILSDRGTQFTSRLMAELHKLLGVKPQFTTPFHPSGNGRVERLPGLLKAILRKLCCEKPKEWHHYIIPTLFALREMPSDRTDFSAFDLLWPVCTRATHCFESPLGGSQSSGRRLY
ncbi:hypothetical protein Pcinc_019441 [Petrolisthes cinctipes]|uniref:Integrase catalytic domain-containing protein n=1 Tax=Petrolisthes cinctipes TaxID=88211 RepID=A0AAE1KKD9_PETCI|nr:hypothetical protein Pcinc_019441 [Petrolisthes cinctipes]